MPGVQTSTAEQSCLVVRRYLTEALFGGDERALRDTVADPVLQERVWMFWAAFTERSLDDVDVLFANGDGSRVACHLIGNMTQVGPWVNATVTEPDGPRPAQVECTGVYMIADGKISNCRETWR